MAGHQLRTALQLLQLMHQLPSNQPISGQGRSACSLVYSCSVFLMHLQASNTSQLDRIPGSVLAEAAACERQADSPIEIKG